MGEMPGTGFTDQQWLVQRDRQFIQVTELLYRIAEQANGEQTLEEIAQAVTDSTEWLVSAENVRQLIHTKLLPLRLVAEANGSVATCDAADREDRTRSALAVNMRIKTLTPRIIDPIAGLLQILHAPPILIPLVIAAGIAHGWLYRVHGIAGSIRDVLYTPGGLLLVLGIVIAAAVFHEFGHASALRYGGGKVRGMGVGLYLIYPAFYTDVTDSYRLGRWARVRTDLGGIYFHLIFALGLIALSWVTGRELLLFAVLMIDLQIMVQFIPFVRFDGYWTLADLTGIPDLFSQIGPFFRSALPASAVQGSRLPDLKPWVRRVFTFYIATAAPLLTFLFFLMIRRLPSFLGRAWNAFLVQTSIWPMAQRQGDLLTMALLVTQMFLLALPVAGSLYILYSVSRTSARLIWNWSKPTPTRRLAGAMSAVAAAAFVGFLWAPQLRELTGGLATPQQEDRSAYVLNRTRKATAELGILQADLEGSLGGTRFTGTVLLKRPNLARVDLQGERGFGEFRVVSDGKRLFTYFPGDNRYGQTYPGPDGRNIHTFVAEQIDDFFRPDSIGALPRGGRFTYIGREAVDGTEYEVIEVSSPALWKKTVRYFIAPRDHLVHRMVVTSERVNGGRTTTWTRLNHIRTDGPVDESAFQWTPPSTAGPLQLPRGIALPLGNSAANNRR